MGPTARPVPGREHAVKISTPREAAYAEAATLYRAEAFDRAALLVLMGDRLADGPAPVPLRGLIVDLVAAGVPGFDGPLPSRRDPATLAIVRRTDKLLARMIREGYLKRDRYQQHAKGGNPMAYVWDLGPRVKINHGDAFPAKDGVAS